MDLIRDVRFAGRSFARTPGFLAVAVVTLALGVGANTAVFSVVNGMYLRPLPFRDPDRLVLVGESARDGSWRMGTETAGTWVDWRDGQQAFEDFAAYRYWTTTVEHRGVVRRILSVHSMGSIFDVLGARPLLGRTFTSEEEGPGAEGLVVLSYPFWQEEFGDEDPVGSTLVIGGVPHTVLGVMPPSFRFPTPAVDLWKTADLSSEQLRDRDDHFIYSLARLAPGRTLEEGRADLERVHAGIREAWPDKSTGTRPELVPLHEALVAGAGTLWGTLMGAVGLALLIACTNLANLLLSRAGAREGELAVRRALGASRARLTRQVLAESALLAALGGIAGLAVGRVLLGGILAWMPGGVPRVEAIGVDGTVTVFTLAVAGLAGLAAGLAPALQLTPTSVGERIRRNRRGGRRPGVRTGLVVAQIALAVVLLTASGLLVRGYAAVRGWDPGFQARERTAFYLEVQGDGHTDTARHAFHRDLEDALLHLPGVRAVGVSSKLPLTGFTPGASVGEPGVPVRAGDGRPTVEYVVVSPGYRKAMGIPLERGRDLTRDDGREGTPSVLLSRAAAEAIVPGGDALGERLYLGPDGVVAPVSTVVGIVGDVRQDGMDRDPPALAYVPQESATWWRGFDLVVETEPGREALADDVRRVVGELNPDALVLRPRRLEDVVDRALADQRNVMLLFALLAAVALLMAVVGVFGVVSFLVERRRREIGIRIAVGASRREVLGLVLRENLSPIGLGAALGAAAGIGLSRFMEGLLAGVTPTDPVAVLSAPAVLVLVALMAVLVPARRAARLDPVRILSRE